MWLGHVLPSLKESHVEGRRVEVDKLEDEHFEGESVIMLGLGSVHLCNVSAEKCSDEVEEM